MRLSFAPKRQYSGPVARSGPRSLIKVRVPFDVKAGIQRAIEAGVFESEQAFGETWIIRGFEELMRQLETGEFDKGVQQMRQLQALTEKARRMPQPGAVAQELIEGLQATLRSDPSQARHYIAEAEKVLHAKPGPRSQQILLVLNASPVWLETKGR